MMTVPNPRGTSDPSSNEPPTRTPAAPDVDMPAHIEQLLLDGNSPQAIIALIHHWDDFGGITEDDLLDQIRRRTATEAAISRAATLIGHLIDTGRISLHDSGTLHPPISAAHLNATPITVDNLHTAPAAALAAAINRWANLFDRHHDDRTVVAAAHLITAYNEHELLDMPSVRRHLVVNANDPHQLAICWNTLDGDPAWAFPPRPSDAETAVRSDLVHVIRLACSLVNGSAVDMHLLAETVAAPNPGGKLTLDALATALRQPTGKSRTDAAITRAARRIYVLQATDNSPYGQPPPADLVASVERMWDDGDPSGAAGPLPAIDRRIYHRWAEQILADADEPHDA